MNKTDVKTKCKYKRWISFFWGSSKYERNESRANLRKIYFLNIHMYIGSDQMMFSFIVRLPLVSFVVLFHENMDLDIKSQLLLYFFLSFPHLQDWPSQVLGAVLTSLTVLSCPCCPWPPSRLPSFCSVRKRGNQPSSSLTVTTLTWTWNLESSWPW